MTFRDSHPNRRPRFSKSLVAVVVFLAVATAASVTRAQNPQPEDVIRVRTDLVAVPAIVTDAHGRRVSGLKQEDFVLRDDGRTERIDYFASGAQRVALAFLLDNSGSLREQLSRQRETALALFSRFGPGSSVAIFNFAARAKLATPFTNNFEQARAGFVIPTSISERTAIFDAAQAAVDAFLSRAGNTTERHIAILISDGLDTGSQVTARSVIQSANGANISFYVIQLPLFTPRDGRLVARPAAKGFRDLAERTGGKYFVAGDARSAMNPETPVDLAPVFAAIEDDLRSQYVIGFYPSEAAHDGRPHTVQVTISNPEHKRLSVRQLRTTYQLKQ